MRPNWPIRVLFLSLCVMGGYATSQMRPELVASGWLGMVIGFGFGWLLIAIDEMLKGFSLRAFSAATFGLILGTAIAWMVDHSGLFDFSDERPALADPAVFVCRLQLHRHGAGHAQQQGGFLPHHPLCPLRLAEPSRKTCCCWTPALLLTDASPTCWTPGFWKGLVVVPRFVLHELQQIADSNDPIIRARGRRGLEMLTRLQQNKRVEVKIHDADFPDEKEVDAKLVRLAKALGRHPLHQ